MKQTKRCHIAVVYSIFIALVLLISDSSAQYTWVDSTDTSGNVIRMKVNDKTGAPHLIYGLDVNFNRYGNITEQNVQGLSRQFLTEHAKLLKIQPGALKFQGATNRNGRWYINFQQEYRGIPVYSANVGFTIHENGNVVLVGSDAHLDISIDTTPSISTDEALNIANSNFAGLSGRDSVGIRNEPELIILSLENDASYSYLLTYNVELELIDSLSVYSEGYFIDANSGNIIRQYSNIRDQSISGTVSIRYWPEHHDDAQSTGAARYENIELFQIFGPYQGERYTNTSGYYVFGGLDAGRYFLRSYLDGSYLVLQQNSEYHYSAVWTGNVHNWTWNASDATNVYYHANLIHDFYKNSPFNYNSMDYRMNAYVNEGSNKNGWSNGIDIGFGSQNGQYWARSSDVVYHEYSHSTAYHLYGNRWIGYNYYGEGWAMDEGLADYFACTINNDPIQGESVGVNRDLDNTHKVGDPIYYQGAHQAGQIIGGACWDLRQDPDMGVSYTNQLVFEALQMTPHAYDFEDFAVNIAVADDDNGKLADSVPHYYDIKQAFQTNHGITLNVPPPRPPPREVKKAVLPQSFNLSQNRPNPFNPTTTIHYELPEASFVKLTIYDIAGREVMIWNMAQQRPGYKQVVWDGKDNNGDLVPTGMYIYRLKARSFESDQEFHMTRKMILLR